MLRNGGKQPFIPANVGNTLPRKKGALEMPGAPSKTAVFCGLQPSLREAEKDEPNNRTGVEVGVIPRDVLDQRRLEQLRRDHRRDLAAAWLRRCQHRPAGNFHAPGTVFARGAPRLLGEDAISICPFR